MKAKEVEVMGFMNTENTDSKEENIMIEVKKKDNKLVAKYKSLKTWQKVAVIAVTGVGLGVGGYAIYRVVTNGQAGDVVEAVAEAATEAGLEAINF